MTSMVKDYEPVLVRFIVVVIATVEVLESPNNVTRMKHRQRSNSSFYKGGHVDHFVLSPYVGHIAPQLWEGMNKPPLKSVSITKVDAMPIDPYVLRYGFGLAPFARGWYGMVNKAILYAFVKR